MRILHNANLIEILKLFKAIGLFMYNQNNNPESDFTKTLSRDRDIIEVNEKIDELIKDEKFLIQLAQSGKKVISVGVLPESLKINFAQLIEKISSLRDEILQKKEDVLTKNSLIKQRVAVLLGSEEVDVDQTEYEKSEISVLEYSGLLDNICAELNSEHISLTLFLSDKCPKHVIVGAHAAESFSVVAQEQINAIKRHVKAIQRDLDVSYSRYSYGFDAQLKRIDYVESLVKKEEIQ